MSRNAEINGRIEPVRPLTAFELDAFRAIIDHNQMSYSISAEDADKGILSISSDTMVDYGYLPLDVSRSERFRARTYSFAEFVSYLTNFPALNNVSYYGEFEMVIEGDLPTIQRVEVTNNKVSLYVAEIVFPTQGEAVTV